jgi:hypothetical protein
VRQTHNNFKQSRVKEQQMRISEMTPEQQAARREYNREQKRKSRANHKAAAYTPTADEWFDSFPTSEHYEELKSYAKRFEETVAEELGREVKDPRFPLGYISPEAETAELVAWTLFSFKKNLIKRVDTPSGEVFGGMYFADVLGSGIVARTHRFNPEASQTYSTAYRELLLLLDRRYGKEPTQHARDIKAEIAGEYLLLPEAKPEPKEPTEQAKPEPKPEIPTPVAEPVHIENMWAQINRDLDEQARRYLAGIR